MDATQRPVLATLNSKRTFVGAQAKPSPARKRIHVQVVDHSNSLADIAMAYPTPVTVAPPKAAAAVRMFGPGEFELSQRVECRHRLCLCTHSSKPPTNHRPQGISILNSFGLSLKTLQQVHLHRLPALEMTSTWICPQMLCHFAQSRCLEKVSPGEIDSSLVCQNCCCCNICFETFLALCLLLIQRDKTVCLRYGVPHICSLSVTDPDVRWTDQRCRVCHRGTRDVVSLFGK
jgi:hypothetical protein